MRNATTKCHLSPRERYELEHLARKYGLQARLAKSCAAEPERDGPDERASAANGTGS